MTTDKLEITTTLLITKEYLKSINIELSDEALAVLELDNFLTTPITNNTKLEEILKGYSQLISDTIKPNQHLFNNILFEDLIGKVRNIIIKSLPS